LVLAGDPSGIGPELIAKLIYRLRHHILICCRPFLIMDKRVLAQGAAIAGANTPFPIHRYCDPRSVPFFSGELALWDTKDIDPADYQLGKESALCGSVVMKQLETALDMLVAKQADALVYAPLNKQAMYLGGNQHGDELRLFAHWLSKKSGWQGTYGEINYTDGIWTTRVTSHIPLREVADSIDEERVGAAIRLADQTLRKAGITKPRLGVAALNPHGGEGGIFGHEEQDVILPAITQARQDGIDARGPYPADTIFRRLKRDLDAVITMYHDQGQIAMKLLGFNSGVTVQGGFPYPITTPCHGTAFDIAGAGRANPGPMLEAIYLAARLAGARGLPPRHALT
jgi:4-hydroxythreonine-4-phosphate dehydrogenase